MHKVNKAVFFITVLVIAAVVAISLFGVDYGFLHINGAPDIRFGIDIRGGVEAVYVPKGLDRLPTTQELETVRAILETRLDAENILDREITVDKNNGEVLVRFPWKSEESTFNPQQAIAELGETALLTFRDTEGNVLIEGKNVKHSSVIVDPQTNENVVSLEFDAEGAEKFSQATQQFVGQQISIYMDETLLSAPRVEQHITGGSAVINGNMNAEQAKDLSDKINSGALPFSLEAKNFSTISPTLGGGALNVMIYAGLTAMLLVCLFMICYYRLPGVVACFGLSLQLACQLLMLSIPQITLTLPGIAGMILSLGMGVDTNIIISERIKEELRAGKTLGSAISTGYRRAFSAVFDGNITTVIVAIVLMIFGSGSVLSFGYTLLTGVLMNFISGITASKLMVTSLSQFRPLRNPVLYGDRRVSA